MILDYTLKRGMRLRCCRSGRTPSGIKFPCRKMCSAGKEKPVPLAYQPGHCIDHYTIIEVLGQGGSGYVYLALDQQQRAVVLKFPDVAELGSAEVFARYQREREIGQHLNHPHIQQHLYADEQRSEEYLVLEYLCGQTLRAVMKKRLPERLSTTEAVGVMTQVVETLIFIHEQGVIHRDIKPDNIFLLEDSEVVLIDFGIAHWEGERWLRFRGFSKPIGTPGYMAPELLLAKAGTVQSDIYAVGAVLFELVCGHTPFAEPNGFAFLTEHISHDPPGILTCDPDLSPALATVIMRAVRRDPGKRYATTRDLLYDLQHLPEVVPTDYLPDLPLVGGRYRQALRIFLIVLCCLGVVVALGLLAQFAHPGPR
jgi:serine/threonine protein kinase